MKKQKCKEQAHSLAGGSRQAVESAIEGSKGSKSISWERLAGKEKWGDNSHTEGTRKVANNG